MTTRERLTGPPTSSNGASSFHLRWELPPRPVLVVEATIELVEPPRVPKLYFWALQASFQQGSRPRGAGHFGLQHHPSYPRSGAVNWGGYHHRSTGHGELPGTSSPLHSTLGNPNTFDYRWQPHTAYRYRIAPGGPGRWRGSITDLDTGVETVVRDLLIDADGLTAVVVWSEVFADCDAPPVTVRWSDFKATTAGGQVVRPSAVTVSYQTVENGGCSNTDVQAAPDGDGSLTQRTNTSRHVQHGARLPI